MLKSLGPGLLHLHDVFALQFVFSIIPDKLISNSYSKFYQLLFIFTYIAFFVCI